VRVAADVIFAVFGVLLAVNMCINYSFFIFIFVVLLLQNIFKILKACHELALDGVYLPKKKKKCLALSVQKLWRGPKV